jgi:hypothetical protein
VVDGGSTIENDVQFRDGVPEDTSTESAVDGSTESTAEDNPFDDEDFSPYAEMVSNTDFMISDVTKDKIKELMDLQRSSTRRMSSDGYVMLRQRYIEENILFEGGSAFPPLYLFEALTATHLEEVPGVKVGRPLMDMLKNDGDMAILKQVAVIVDNIYQDFLEE